VSECAGDGHCITCSDEGVQMRVLELIETGVARCATDDGATSEVMCDLVGAVSRGDAVLVHAGVALLRLP
jgi:hydrogenase maturation factor